jgi:uncharacterized membrane protein
MGKEPVAMENRHECKVIGIEADAITLLLDTGKKETISKDLIPFTVYRGDTLLAYLDDSNTVVFVEQKPADEKPQAADRTNVYVTHATAQGYDEGSFWGGFFLTFFFPVVGLIIALVMNKKETRRGAVRAIVVQLITFAVLVLMGFCTVYSSY